VLPSARADASAQPALPEDPPMGDWGSFFVAEVGASATLAGLIFVGVSINLAKIIASPRLPNYALEALVALLAVLGVSSLQLVPRQPPALVGGEVLLVGLGAWGIVSALHWGNLGKVEHEHRQSVTVQVVLGQIATLPFVIAGVALITRGAGGLYWIVPGIMFSFMDAFVNAWVLLVEINR
jgi:hypothetical protein